MIDYFEPIKREIASIKQRLITGMPVFSWGAVTQVSPLLVLPEFAAAPIEASTGVAGLGEGDRVYFVRSNGRAVVLIKAKGQAAPQAATQSEVNTGVGTQYVSPETLKGRLTVIPQVSVTSGSFTVSPMGRVNITNVGAVLLDDAFIEDIEYEVRFYLTGSISSILLPRLASNGMPYAGTTYQNGRHYQINTGGGYQQNLGEDAITVVPSNARAWHGYLRIFGAGMARETRILGHTTLTDVPNGMGSFGQQTSGTIETSATVRDGIYFTATAGTLSGWIQVIPLLA